jgi:flavin-dependent dehydrogenase
LFDVDVAVVGGGPAGSATAIACAEAGLRVLLIERRRFPRIVPGETLHPGVLPILRQLGVEATVSAAGFLRHAGHFVRWGDDTERFVPFGRDADGPWLGLQAWRADFDALLMARARQLGARVLQPCATGRPSLLGDRLVGLETSCGSVRATYIVDASGRRRWLSRHLGLAAEVQGQRRLVWYGYVEGECPARDTAPALRGERDGWTWIARVRPRVYQWTRWSRDNRRPAASWLPAELRDLQALGPIRGADMTCQVARAPAGPGYYLVGDSAAILDPASSHGILRALMSGLLVAHLLGQIISGRCQASAAGAYYCGWLHAWCRHDVEELQRLYEALDPPRAPSVVGARGCVEQWPGLGECKIPGIPSWQR